MDNKPQKGGYLEVLLRSPRTIFSMMDIALLWGESTQNAVRVRLNSYVRKGKLVRVRRGIYAKDNNYDRFEMATRIYTPAYISFETVLTREGISFQFYDTIFIASYVSREIEIDGQKVAFVRLKDYVLSNTLGIDSAGIYSIATKERAFLDRIYVSRDYHFDNLNVLDWDKVFEILPIYQNKRMSSRVRKYYKNYQANK